MLSSQISFCFQCLAWLLVRTVYRKISPGMAPTGFNPFVWLSLSKYPNDAFSNETLSIQREINTKHKTN